MDEKREEGPENKLIPRNEMMEGLQRALESRGLNPKDPDILAQILVERTISSTTGLYPPPQMLAEYKAVDPRVFEQIVEGANAQSEHRQSLEKAATEASFKRQGRADITQNVCAIGSIIVSAGLVFSQIWFGQEIHWIFPSILVAIGVGGRPVATLIATAMLRSRMEKSSLMD